ncbi:lipoate-protein ligase [Babesia caballi]|uniref:lipoate--protein ligase n=1 Tax=Babesia caballi TaxID=5871 RepID=A0AAV4M106_BABCB|nr:lipoate-protein ligase [Babesia caballi]
MAALSLFRRCFCGGGRPRGRALRVLLSEVNDIYFNLALENALLNSYGTSAAKDGTPEPPMLFLWRNSPCVIVGRNQNVWAECNLERVKQDNVKIVRRFTGGGAVYQDLGNTCFTFISPANDYSFERNSKLICDAIGKLIGSIISAFVVVPRFRNEVRAQRQERPLYQRSEGVARQVPHPRQVQAGEAQRTERQSARHQPLPVQPRRLPQNRERDPLAPDPRQVCEAIIAEVSAFYGAKDREVELIDKTSPYCTKNDFIECYDKLIVSARAPPPIRAQDEQWIYGDRVLQYKSLRTRFDFGSVEFCFDLTDGIVARMWIFSDCLNADFIAWLSDKLNQTPLRFTAEDFDRAIAELSYDGAENMLQAIREWLVAELRRAEGAPSTEDETAKLETEAEPKPAPEPGSS